MGKMFCMPQFRKIGVDLPMLTDKFSGSAFDGLKPLSAELLGDAVRCIDSISRGEIQPLEKGGRGSDSRPQEQFTK
jgi:hypothetical protein